MKVTIEKEFMLGGIQEKERVNLYTLVELPHYSSTITAIGNKIEGLAERQTVTVKMNINIQTEVLYKLNEKSGKYEKVWVDTAKRFIEDIKVNG